MQVFQDFKRYAFIACLICIFLPGTAYSIMLPLSTENLKVQSDVVLRGSVEDVTGLWSNDHMIIVTHVEIAVHDVYKGKLHNDLVKVKEIVPGTLSKDLITVEFDGGKADDVEFGVSDMPRFKKGEEVIVFLKIEQSRIKNRIYKLVGSSQGKYIIDEDGLVKKEGFGVLLEKEEDKDLIDNHIPVGELVEKIDENRAAFIHVDRPKTEGNSHEHSQKI